MSEPYVSVSQKFMDDPRVQALPWAPRALLALLLVCPEMTAVPGLILRAFKSALAESFGMELAAFADAFAALERAGLVCADWAARVVYLPDPVRWSCTVGVQSIHRAALWRRELMKAPACDLTERADYQLRRALAGRPKMLECFMNGRSVERPGEQLEMRFAPRLRVVSAPFDEPRPEPTAPAVPANPAQPAQLAWPVPAPIAPPPRPLPSPQLPSTPRPTAPVHAMGDDDVVAAWAAVVAGAGNGDAVTGAAVLGLKRKHATVTGMPGASECMWARAWQELRQAMPAPTIEDARKLGEWIKAGGLGGIRIPLWEYLCKGGVVGALDQMQLAEAKPAEQRQTGMVRGRWVPPAIEVCQLDQDEYLEMSRVSA